MSSHPSELGTSPQNPIRVGGGRVFGPFNERQYLARLLSLNGQPPEFRRLGSVDAASGENPLDRYELSGAGLTEPVRLYLDMYSVASPLDPPRGFVFSRPDEPLNLARSLVLMFRAPDEVPQQQPPRRWLLQDAAGRPLGSASWDGLSGVALDLHPQLERLVRMVLDQKLSVTPWAQVHEVLEDIFERFLVLESGGAVHGVPDTEQGALPEEPPLSDPEPPMAWELHCMDGPRGSATWLGGTQLDLNTGPALKGLLQNELAPLLAGPRVGARVAAYFERLRATSGGEFWAKPVPRKIVLETLYDDYKHNTFPDDLSPASILAATLAGKLVWTTTRKSGAGNESSFKAGGQHGGREHWLAVGTKASDARSQFLSITTGPSNPPRLVEQRDGFFLKSELGKLLKHLRNGGGQGSKRGPQLPKRYGDE